MSPQMPPSKQPRLEQQAVSPCRMQSPIQVHSGHNSKEKPEISEVLHKLTKSGTQVVVKNTPGSVDKNERENNGKVDTPKTFVKVNSQFILVNSPQGSKFLATPIVTPCSKSSSICYSDISVTLKHPESQSTNKFNKSERKSKKLENDEKVTKTTEVRQSKPKPAKETSKDNSRRKSSSNKEKAQLRNASPIVHPVTPKCVEETHSRSAAQSPSPVQCETTPKISLFTGLKSMMDSPAITKPDKVPTVSPSVRSCETTPKTSFLTGSKNLPVVGSKGEKIVKLRKVKTAASTKPLVKALGNPLLINNGPSDKVQSQVNNVLPKNGYVLKLSSVMDSSNATIIHQNKVLKVHGVSICEEDKEISSTQQTAVEPSKIEEQIPMEVTASMEKPIVETKEEHRKPPHDFQMIDTPNTGSTPVLSPDLLLPQINSSEGDKEVDDLLEFLDPSLVTVIPEPETDKSTLQNDDLPEITESVNLPEDNDFRPVTEVVESQLSLIQELADLLESTDAYNLKPMSSEDSEVIPGFGEKMNLPEPVLDTDALMTVENVETVLTIEKELSDFSEATLVEQAIKLNSGKNIEDELSELMDGESENDEENVSKIQNGEEQKLDCGGTTFIQVYMNSLSKKKRLKPKDTVL
jgi:hypothetical protein